MKKKLALVFALVNDNDKEYHYHRLLESYHILAILPISNSRTEWQQRLLQHIEVPYPYTESSVHDTVSKIQEWETINGRLDGIITLSETGVEHTALVIEKLNETRSGHAPLLRGMPSRTARITRNKFHFRQLVAPLCKDIGSFLMKSYDDVELARKFVRFPAILKPAQGMGSMCVRKVESFQQLRMIFDEVQIFYLYHSLPFFTIQRYD